MTAQSATRLGGVLHRSWWCLPRHQLSTFHQANQDGKPNEVGNQDEVMSKSRDDVLFPLDGARGFTGDVEGYSVHVSDLVGDSVGDFCNQVIRQPGPVSCHGVFT